MEPALKRPPGDFSTRVRSLQAGAHKRRGERTRRTSNPVEPRVLRGADRLLKFGRLDSPVDRLVAFIRPDAARGVVLIHHIDVRVYGWRRSLPAAGVFRGAIAELELLLAAFRSAPRF